MVTISNSSLGFHTRSTAQMGAVRRDAERLQQQLSTGTRITRSSDDPVAAACLRTLDRADRLAAVDGANAARAAGDLSLAGDALEAVAADLTRVRELALWAANGALSPEGRAAVGQEIATLRDTILATANARDMSGNPLFAGEGRGPAYTVGPDGTAQYRGTAQSGQLSLGEGQAVERGVTGPQFLSFQSAGASVDLFAFLRQLGDALQTGANDPAGMSAAVTTLGAALDAVTRTQTVVGARLGWIEAVQDRQVTGGEARAQQAADAGGVDFADTVARLQQTLTVLEASQTGFARLAQLSLFDAI